jgi:hypothetical protein
LGKAGWSIVLFLDCEYNLALRLVFLGRIEVSTHCIFYTGIRLSAVTLTVAFSL